MRAFAAALGAAVLHSLARQTNAHPLCYHEDRPTDPDAELVFCPDQPAYGACCTESEETAAITVYQAAIGNGTQVSSDCAAYYRQVACGPCNSFSAHLYEVLGSELGAEDGMTMTYDFCQALTTACDGEVDFPTYDGESYCEKHTLGSTGLATDAYWAYPLTPDKTNFSTAGLEDAFPDLDDSQMPSDLICMHMTLDGTEWWLGGQDGQIMKVIALGATTSTLVLDLSSGAELYVAYEEGLLDFAFSPAFESNNYFYVSYTILDSEGAKNRLSRFTYSSTPAATLASIDIIITSEAKATSIHSAGWVGFKPSDYTNPSGSSHDIYWATGDGGPQTDPNGAGQDTGNLLGAMIRVSVPSGTSATDVGYTIPSGNYDGERGEICAPGFRNPFRCGFDRATDDLYCGDVGHTNVEEVDIVECGQNYGWARFEGSRCQEALEDLYGDCDGASRSEYTFPIYEYCHTGYFSTDPTEAEFTDGVDICGNRGVVGFAVIGGTVYHGQRFADVLEGAYIFGDNQMQKIFYLTQMDGMWTPGVILSEGAPVIAFAEDNEGEIFVITEGDTRRAYTLPCGDLCATTCLEQADTAVTYTSLGCYADVSSDRALQLDDSPNCGDGENAMSPDICASYCATFEDAVYFGVQFAEECFCGAAGEDYAKHGELDDFSCTYFCIGNTDYFCGGRNAIEVYEFEPAPTPSLPPVSVPPISTLPPMIPSTLPPGATPTPAETTPEPTSSSSGATPSPTSNDYIYLGCYGDASARALSGASTSSSSMTIEFCATFCEGSQYFGTQFSTQCYCSSPGDDYDVYGPATCGNSCAGDSSQTCGGSWAVSMYEYANYSPPPTPTPIGYAYVGCYGDAADRALSGASTSSFEMTTSLCASFCQGSDFFGTEFGIECFCSAVGDDYEEYGTATCSDACGGRSSEICGDSYALSVYEYTSVSPAPGAPTPAPEAPTPVPTAQLQPTPVPTSTMEPTPLSSGANAPTIPTPSPAETTYTRVGCYTDSKADRLLAADSTSTSLMTTETCEAFCVGYTYFGTEFGNECFCGSPASLGTDTATNCNMDCAGDSSQTCGGRDAIEVYEYTDAVFTPAPAPTITLSYLELGCYADSKEARLLSGDSTSSNAMTTEFCESFCVGYGYFGTEFGNECFCGSPASLGSDTDANCNMDCAGDSSQTCGGRDAITVYQFA